MTGSGGDAAVDAVVSTVGLWWPDAEEADLRAAADAWDRAAAALDDAARSGRTAATEVAGGLAGDSARAVGEHWSRVERDGLAPSAEGCRALAAGLRRYADEVETAKHEIEALAVEIGAGLVLGAATAWLTFGASAAVAGGIAARLVAAAAAIGVRVSGSVAGIAATSLSAAAFGTVDAVAANVVGQAFQVEVLDEGGWSASELGTAAAWGGAGGAVLGAAPGALATRALRHPAPGPELLRAPGGAIRAALEPTDWGPLHRSWAPGLREDAQRLAPHERAGAQVYVNEGAMVHARPPRQVDNYGNPDLLVRRSPTDPGTYTELKTVSNSPNSVDQNLRKALSQLRQVGGGEAVLDGRAAGLTREVAEAGWARRLPHLTAGDHATRVRILLLDGELGLP